MSTVANDPITAHGGGELVDLRVPSADQARVRADAAKLPTVTLGARELADLEMLASGAFSPLTGFMDQADYVRSRDEMRLASGVPWSIPITLGVEEAEAKKLSVGEEVALATENGARLATMTIGEIYQVDRTKEAEAVFGTSDPAHPGVKNVLASPPWCLAGKVVLFEDLPNQTFPEYRLDPRATRAKFREKGWKKIVAFQTRNPTHRAHEYIQKAALEICDGLLLHPLVGETKGDDVPAAVRMDTYKVLLDLYYPKDRAMLSVMPAHMRYGGPREAILHAIIRRNYGCTHFIVGRDHAGVGNYYGTYDAQKLFERFAPEEMGITPLTFENTFYCGKCGGMASFKTCPHTDADRLLLSGTKVRDMLRGGEAPPPEYTRPEIAAILMRAMGESKQ
jgi:sulfate adenylyltransferase